MSFIEGTASFVNPLGGTTVLDSNYEPVYTPTSPIVVTNATFNQLSSTEQAQRQQLQDDSTHKVRIDFNDLNKIINFTYTVEIEGKEYEITGDPKHPIMCEGRITIYLRTDGKVVETTPVGLLLVSYSDGTGINDLVVAYSNGTGANDLILTYGVE